MTEEAVPVIFVAVTFVFLASGYPVAFVLAGVASVTGMLAIAFGLFDIGFLHALPGRLFQIFLNDVFQAIPLFVLMGVTIEKSGLARSLFTELASRLGHLKGGLAIAVVLAGGILAAMTGIVGASVVSLSLIAFRPLLNAGYSQSQASGVIVASGTLGQLIPPSIVLLILADVMQTANSQAELERGNFAPDPVVSTDLFAAALLPGLLLVASYIVLLSLFGPRCEKGLKPDAQTSLLASLRLPLLAVIVLGSILAGLATIGEAAAVGSFLAILFAGREKIRDNFAAIGRETVLISAVIFAILVGATIWSLIFRGLGGDALVRESIQNIPGGLYGSLFAVMAIIFILGFFLEMVEILLIVVPLTAPVLILAGADPVWLAILIALNLQTSFLTPPMGVSLFYFKSAVPGIPTVELYRGIVVFVAAQIFVLSVVAFLPITTQVMIR